jgi:hypothetical protein
MLLTLLLSSITPVAPLRAEPGIDGMRIAQVLVQERVIIRVPVRPPPIAAPIEFKEHKGPKCIQSAQIVGAAVTRGGAVDFILKGHQRVRARFERACPALDFYSGFYLKPNPDGRICARRDSIHARSGGGCEIQHFRKLEPYQPDRDD